MIYTILVLVLIKKAKKDMATYLLILYISFFRTLPYKHIDVQRLASHSRNMTFHIKWSCIHFRSIQLSRFFDFSTVFFFCSKTVLSYVFHSFISFSVNNNVHFYLFGVWCLYACFTFIYTKFLPYIFKLQCMMYLQKIKCN